MSIQNKDTVGHVPCWGLAVLRLPHALHSHGRVAKAGWRHSHEIFRWCAVLFGYSYSIVPRQGPQPENVPSQRSRTKPDPPLHPLAIASLLLHPFAKSRRGPDFSSFSSSSGLVEALNYESNKVVARQRHNTWCSLAHCNESCIHDSMSCLACIYVHIPPVPTMHLKEIKCFLYSYGFN